MDVWEELKIEAYQEGRQEGIEMEAMTIVSSLILHMPDTSDETIANLTSKPKQLVARVRMEMQQNKR